MNPACEIQVNASWSKFDAGALVSVMHSIRASPDTPGQSHFLRRAMLLCFVAAVASVLGRVAECNAQSGNNGEIRRIIAGVSNDYAPYEFVDSGGAITGYDVDLLRAVCRAIHIDVSFVAKPWNEIRDELDRSAVDVLPGMLYSEERQSLVEFTEPHLAVSYSIFVRANEPPIEDMAHLKGRRVSVERDSQLHEHLAKQGLGEEIVPVESEPEALRALAAGTTDAAVLPYLIGMLMIRDGLEGVRPSGQPVWTRRLCFAVRKGEIELQAHLNTGLAIVRQTGEYDEIHEKWFGELQQDVRPLGKWIVIAAWIVLPLAGVTVAAGVWSWSLKRQVASKTGELREKVLSLQRAQEWQRLMMNELDHRVKNNLAAVLSIAENTRRHTTSLDDFYVAFNGRLAAMARMHSLLAQTKWKGMQLLEIVRITLGPYLDDRTGQVQIHGDDCVLPARAATALCMTLHELATNAAKHGALTSEKGRINISWIIQEDQSHRKQFKLNWTERGIPVAETAGKSGFGLTLIRGAIRHELAGNVDFALAADKLDCVIEFEINHREHEATISESEFESVHARNAP